MCHDMGSRSSWGLLQEQQRRQSAPGSARANASEPIADPPARVTARDSAPATGQPSGGGSPAPAPHQSSPTTWQLPGGPSGMRFPDESRCYKRRTQPRLTGAESGVDSHGPAQSCAHDELVGRPGSSAAPTESALRATATKDPAPARGKSALASSMPSTPVRGSGSSVMVDPGAPSQRRTRLQQGVIQHVDYKHITKYGIVCSTGEPSTLEEALGAQKWKKAMEEEYLALEKNN